MTDDERPDDEAREQSEASEEPEASEEDPQASEEPEAQASEEPEPQTPEEPDAGEQPEAPAAEAEKERSERERPQKGGDGPPESVPGADLEPIRIEDEEELSFEERARREAEAEERARLEAMQAEDRLEEPLARPAGQLEAGARYGATGKRKRSVARVILVPGEGRIQVNGRDMADYFPRERLQYTIRQPLLATGYETSVDVQIRVHGGGIAGQADAVRHGIARALTEIDGELRGELKRRGYLRRDARVKERRKAGLKKARKRPQFSKR